MDDILDMNVDELGVQLMEGGQATRRLTKPKRQKLLKLLSDERTPEREEWQGSIHSLLVDESFRLQDRDREGDYEVQKLRLQVELEEKRLIQRGTNLDLN